LTKRGDFCKQRATEDRVTLIGGENEKENDYYFCGHLVFFFWPLGWWME
jgi:hypothetical protein